MKWLLLTLRSQYIAPAAIVLGVLTAPSRDLSIIIPVFSPRTPFGQLPLDAVVPLLVCVMIGTVQSAASTRETAAAARGLNRMLILFGAVVSVLYVAAHSLTATVFLGSSTMDVSRNMCGYFALLVAAHIIIGLRYAPMVPVLYLFLSTLFGRGPNGSVQPWAWPVQTAQTADLLVAIAIMVLITAYALSKPPSRVRASSLL